MPAAADRELQVARAGGANRRGDVVGVGRVGDRGRPTVERAVPGRADAVVVGVTGVDDAADEAGGSEGRDEVGGWGWRWSWSHLGAGWWRGRRGRPLSVIPSFLGPAGFRGDGFVAPRAEAQQKAREPSQSCRLPNPQ